VFLRVMIKFDPQRGKAFDFTAKVIQNACKVLNLKCLKYRSRYQNERPEYE
jgi:hypothetical protein